ncbi:MAG: pilus (MSHA type) biogenesis protein MshL [Rhodocyclaceae bacterium]|nr:pilus (MSHA type) biogenesis protein MshL [Rhodocyclaceae bacterium]
MHATPTTRAHPAYAVSAGMSILTFVVLSGCVGTSITPQTQAHLARADSKSLEKQSIPPPVRHSFSLPPPLQIAPAETYSVVVNRVGVHDLLFALARDAQVNVDIHPGINGNVTLNALDQTLQQLLTRIARQVDMRFELEGNVLTVMPDSPYLRHYKIDYVNLARDTTGSLSVTTQVANTGAAMGTAAAGNNSITRIENRVQNHFWETLVQNVKDILHETDKILPEGSSETTVEKNDTQSTTGTGATPAAAVPAAAAAPARTRKGASASPGGAATLAASPNPASLRNQATTVTRTITYREAASVIAHAESGVLSVRATARQHEKIAEFLDHVMHAARRQVLIEATVLEVQLSDNYQQGIDWSRLRLDGTGFRFSQRAAGTLAAPPASLFELGYTNPDSRFGNLSATVRLLESFGNVKVLSSPKLSVMNNQTAVLKVVDNAVYFTIQSNTNQNQSTTTTTFTTNLYSVPVGFVMNVIPQVSEAGAIVLNVRPSVSRIIGTVADPNPELKRAGVTSEIPVIRTREMESVLRVEDGNIAVMGGLMEDVLDRRDDTVPLLSRLPVVGGLFSNRNDTVRKTELVVFLRPTVIRRASLEGDYGHLAGALPGRDFFRNNPEPAPWSGVAGGDGQR